MYPCDLPHSILSQDPDLTQLADDCELVQRLVADAERALEQEVRAGRLRARTGDVRDFVDAQGRLYHVRIVTRHAGVGGAVAPLDEVVFETVDGRRLGSVPMQRSLALGKLSAEELQAMLDRIEAPDWPIDPCA